MRARELRMLRGKDVGMIFQEPMTSLNPVLTVGAQIAETVRLHEGLSAATRRGARPSCLRWSASPTRSGACANIRTSCPAACGSA